MRKNFSTHIKPILLCMVALAVVTVTVLATKPSVATADSGVVLAKANASHRPEPPRKIYVDDDDQYRRRPPRRPVSDDEYRRVPPPQKPSDDKTTRPAKPPRRPSDEKTTRPARPTKPNTKPSNGKATRPTPPHPRPTKPSTPERPTNDKTRPDSQPQKPSTPPPLQQVPVDDKNQNSFGRPSQKPGGNSQIYFEDSAESDLRKKAARFSRVWYRTNRDEVLRIKDLSWEWKYGKTYSNDGKTFDSGRVTGYENGKLVLTGRSGKYYVSFKNNQLQFETPGDRRLTFK